MHNPFTRTDPTNWDVWLPHNEGKCPRCCSGDCINGEQPQKRCHNYRDSQYSLLSLFMRTYISVSTICGHLCRMCLPLYSVMMVCINIRSTQVSIHSSCAQCTNSVATPRRMPTHMKISRVYFLLVVLCGFCKYRDFNVDRMTFRLLVNTRRLAAGQAWRVMTNLIIPSLPFITVDRDHQQQRESRTCAM